VHLIDMSRHEKAALAACRADRTDRTLLEDYRERHTAGLRAALRALARAWRKTAAPIS
jgi:hypothetical protein